MTRRPRCIDFCRRQHGGRPSAVAARASSTRRLAAPARPLGNGRLVAAGPVGRPQRGRQSVHVALRDETDGAAGHRRRLARCARSGRFPSLAAVRPGAIRLERTLRDLFGLAAEGAWDTRPWLDHGTWRLAIRLPRRHRRRHARRPTTRCRGLPVPARRMARGMHQIPVGPVHAGIIEPGHFRFTANGETVVRLEERLGYVHKGIEGLMVGKTPAEGAKLAGAHLRRQHGRPRSRLRPRGRSRARARSAAARRTGCGR